MPYKNPPIISAEEAANFLQDGMTLSVNTMSAVSYPDSLSRALRDRFRATGGPRNLSFWGTTAQALYQLDALTEQLARCEGMFSKVVMGHWTTTPTFVQHAAENKFAAYNFPQGVISHLYRAAAGKKPVVVTRVGLGTFADPRYGGGKMNAKAVEDYVSVVTIDGKEYLQYRTPKIDVCFIRGTTADPMGNITAEKEAAYIDALQLALATRGNGGKVIVQVERVSARRAYCKEILIPYVAVDYIVVDPEQRQTYIEPYNPAYSGQTIMPAEHINAHMQAVLEKSGGFFAPRGIEHYAIARRAAEELKPGFVVNIGIGIPGLVPGILAEKGIQDQVHLTNEAGTIGGVPAPSGSFGASLNPVFMTDMSTMFDLYDGGMLDMVCVGTAQVDAKGNVNVGTIGPKVVGVGGFVNLTTAARKVAFLTTFTAKGLKTSFQDGKLKIEQEGSVKKFLQKADQISFNATIAAEENREILYVTERCVFKLTQQGLLLIEIAPGIDLEKDIFGQMEFKPMVADNLKEMEKDFFRI
jgi:propionate CoA-transferase